MLKGTDWEQVLFAEVPTPRECEELQAEETALFNSEIGLQFKQFTYTQAERDAAELRWAKNHLGIVDAPQSAPEKD